MKNNLKQLDTKITGSTKMKNGNGQKNYFEFQCIKRLAI
jgi:hypothetical protein